jgi:hypothetical protein
MGCRQYNVVLGDNIADFSNFWNNLPVAFLGIARKPIQAIPSKTLINPPEETFRPQYRSRNQEILTWPRGWVFLG